MGVSTLVSEQEYLRTSYESPVPDFVEGELVERALPNLSHSRVQVRLSQILANLAERMNLHPFSELRLRVAERRYRIADFVVFVGRMPTSELPEITPFAVFEILSPGEAYDKLIAKFGDYERAGIPRIWLVEPAFQRVLIYRDGSLTVVESLDFEPVNVTIRVADLFGKE